MKQLSKYSIGMGDRFAHQASYQLKAVVEATQKGFDISPVWNKSNREHTTIGSAPADARKAVEATIKEMGWNKLYFVDADHINLDTVDRFMDSSDFFTIDVASYIGKQGDCAKKEDFLAKMKPYIGSFNIPGIARAIEVTQAQVSAIADQYLYAACMGARPIKKLQQQKARATSSPKYRWTRCRTPRLRWSFSSSWPCWPITRYRPRPLRPNLPVASTREWTT